MANIVRCPTCGGSRFVYDMGQPSSVPMKDHLKGTTYLGGQDDSCKCDK